MNPEAGLSVQRRALHGALVALLLILATTPALASFVPARLSGSTTPRISTPSQPFPCLLSFSSPSLPLPPPPTSQGNVTRFEYLKNGRLSKAISPTGRETLFEWDPCGNRTGVVDALGQRTAMHYDAANRLVRTEYFTAEDPTTPVRVVDFAFDDLDRMTSWSDGTFSGVLTHDELGRKVSETVDYGPFTLTNSYGYNANGSRKSFTGPDGITVTYTRDGADRLRSLVVPGVGEVAYREYQWNALTKLALPGGTTFDYGHDALQRVTSATSRDPGGNPLLTRGYEYTPSGDLAAMTTERGSHGFSYDHHRLAAATNPELPAEAYTWDLLDNRVSSAQAPGEWTYDAESQLLSFPGGACDHDALGRTVRKVVGGVEQIYVYDPAGRLERIEDGTGFVVARYAYDPFGRRLWKQIADLPRTFYAYGDEGLVGEYDEEGHELCAYGYEPGSAWSTAPLWLRRDGITYFYHVDRQGRPYKLTDTSGAVVWEAIYDSFGGSTLLANDATQNLRQPGQYFDVESGLCYNWHRYYDPALGRYLTPDPLGEGANPYGYAAGNPLAYTDPMGLCAVAAKLGVWAGGALIGAVGTSAAPIVAVLAVADWLLFADTWGTLVYNLSSDEKSSTVCSRLLQAAFGVSKETADKVAALGGAFAGGAAAGAAKAAAARAAGGGALDGHHPIPKVLGGIDDQIKASLRRGIHQIRRGSESLHSMLREEFKRLGLPSISGGVAGSRSAWMNRYMVRDPRLQQRAFTAVMRVYQKFDKMHGTSLLSDFFANLREGNFEAVGSMRDYVF